MQDLRHSQSSGQATYGQGIGIPWLLIAAAAAFVLFVIIASPARASQGAQEQSAGDFPCGRFYCR